jgi:hypothetical protein
MYVRSIAIESGVARAAIGARARARGSGALARKAAAEARSEAINVSFMIANC